MGASSRMAAAQAFVLFGGDEDEETTSPREGGALEL